MAICREFHKYHRKYPDTGWHYKAISCKLTEGNRKREVVFYTLNNKGKRSKGVEVFSGRNYLTDSNAPSHSRTYDLKHVPTTLKPFVDVLRAKHAKTTWSKKSYVNLH